MRRSGRIPKELAILLLGTDTSGRVFSEETRTIVLSRHGAGILSRNKLAPDEVLTLRLLDSGREADIRLVGHLGEKPRGYVYGVAFLDPSLNFWEVDFPPPPEQHLLPPGVALECSLCAERQLVHQTEIEADVYLVSSMVFRYCEKCGQTTPWRHALGDVPAAPPPVSKIVSPAASLHESIPLHPASFGAASALSQNSLPAHPQPSSSTYVGTAVLEELVSAGFAHIQPAAPPSPTPASAAEVSAAPSSPSVQPASLPATTARGKNNRRQHVRARVTFTACIRLGPASEELVECDNISKGGLCFRSRKRYSEGTRIEVAVPYSPGEHAIFVPAKIKRVEELPAANLFRYGAAYG